MAQVQGDAGNRGGLSMVGKTLDEAVLRSWIGRTEQCTDVIDAGRARLMQSTLDHEPALRDGDTLPPLWHWIYFLSAVRLGELGRDGHPRLGGFIPPVDLPRRMWAGGRLEFSTPPRLGERIVRTSRIEDVRLKRGRTGMLCFVTVRHEFAGSAGEPRFSEEHDIVYREDPSPGCAPPTPPAPPRGAHWTRTIEPSPVLLFRYSALTFNGHRIHYDRDYCRDVEGYPGLVFHGPLTATLLAELAITRMPGRRLRGFSFRAVAPLFDTAPFVIRGKPLEDTGEGVGNGVEAWAETTGGGLAMHATATF